MSLEDYQVAVTLFVGISIIASTGFIAWRNKVERKISNSIQIIDMFERKIDKKIIDNLNDKIDNVSNDDKLKLLNTLERLLEYKNWIDAHMFNCTFGDILSEVHSERILRFINMIKDHRDVDGKLDIFKNLLNYWKQEGTPIIGDSLSDP